MKSPAYLYILHIAPFFELSNPIWQWLRQRERTTLYLHSRVRGALVRRTSSPNQSPTVQPPLLPLRQELPKDRYAGCEPTCSPAPQQVGNHGLSVTNPCGH